MAYTSPSSEPASWGGEDREFPLSEKEYGYLTSLVYDRSGIVLGPNKMNMVYSRLVRRLRELRLSSFRDYCQLVAGDDGDQEIGFLINAITTNLTKFFRENHHFEHLSHEVIPAAARSGSRRLRIWSAGCSSGEEPYSLAITLAQALPDLNRWDARILATDLDTSMVATGAAGIYPSAAVGELPKAISTKYFQRHAGGGDKYQLIEPIRRLISFKHLNLLGPWPLKGPFDAIFCRNVMIYFDGPTKTTLVRRYGELLKPQGWLYIGHAESLQEQNTGFHPVGRTIYRKLA